MDENELDDILDDALEDFEEEEKQHHQQKRQQQQKPLKQPPHSLPNNVAHVFAPQNAAPRKGFPSSSEKENFSQLPQSPPSAREFQDFLSSISKSAASEQPQRAAAAEQQRESSPPQSDADVDLDKIFESMGDDEKKMIDSFAKEMDKFFHDMAPEKEAQRKSEQAPPPQQQQQQQEQAQQQQEEGLKGSIEETLRLLAKHSKEMKDMDPNAVLGGANDEESVKNLMNMFEKMSTGGGQPGEEKDEQQMFSFLEKIMESLMSPDVLKAPMEQLREKYPVWLAKNKDKLSKEEFQRVSQQYEYACIICKVYETESFPSCMPKLIDLMKKMQELGQPPEELVSQLNVSGGQGGSNLPPLPDLPENCTIQ